MATGFAGKRGLGWVLIASWLIPGLMTLAYLILMATSDTDNTGKAWESIGLGFVLVLWWLFRLLTGHAAMSRAIAVGDAERVLELADRQLRGRRRASVRSRVHVDRAIAFEIRGDWTAALAALDQADLTKVPPRSRLLASTVRVAALVETGKPADARAAFESGLKSPQRDPALIPLVKLAEARVLWSEGQRDAAIAMFTKLIDDVRAGTSTRGAAELYLSRMAAARGDAVAAQRHRALAVKLSPTTWVAKAA